MTSNTKRLYTIVPNEFAEGLYVFTKYENGEFIKSYGILEDEIECMKKEAENEGYTFARDIDFLKEEIARYQYIVDDLKAQLNEAIASGNYVEEA